MRNSSGIVTEVCVVAIISMVFSFVFGFQFGKDYERERHKCPVLESPYKCHGTIKDGCEDCSEE